MIDHNVFRWMFAAAPWTVISKKTLNHATSNQRHMTLHNGTSSDPVLSTEGAGHFTVTFFGLIDWEAIRNHLISLLDSHRSPLNPWKQSHFLFAADSLHLPRPLQNSTEQLFISGEKWNMWAKKASEWKILSTMNTKLHLACQIFCKYVGN